MASANSINIARLIPQTFYYFEAIKQIPSTEKVVFSVPSGNFGNLTAGLIAKKMGLPINRFIASVNSNKVFEKYILNGIYEPLTSIQTISNAMDVGNPSNYVRIMELYHHHREQIINDISCFSFNDEETYEAMNEIFHSYKYIMDPHGAVGYLGLRKYQEQNPACTGIILETAHPAKFIDVVEKNNRLKVAVPNQLIALENKQKRALNLSVSYHDFKAFLLKGRTE